MGFLFSKPLLSCFSIKKRKKLLILGLDKAGKTAILYQLRMQEMINSIPTIAFNVESVKREDYKFTI